MTAEPAPRSVLVTGAGSGLGAPVELKRGVTRHELGHVVQAGGQSDYAVDDPQRPTLLLAPVGGGQTTPDDVWVEVRAPRAVPVPETERVPWWEAVGRVVPDVGTIREVGMSGDQAWVRCGDYDPDGVAPDGTVEVLREDGDA